MTITPQQLLQIIPNAGPVAGVFTPALNAAMERYQINTPARIAAFIAQVAHESANLTRLVENLNYSAQGLAATWPSRYAIDANATPPQPNPLALTLARNPQGLANDVYADRMGNGAPDSGDGWTYRGRGALQVTGKANYRSLGIALTLDLLNHPELLENPVYAALSAARFWSANNLNGLADAGNFGDIGSVINTGRRGNIPVGAADRTALYQRALRVLA
ncbi:glycoside hydrolase family 19 protein [Pseudomonas sp. dw_358]|uniref:glycoside hydrolase family 19 protein n=1 Tax=Pseudomonas sp. dw_358 TaxID=2720083 RepID=UPI001BD55ABC|nr:glycoside hydrolase family 19 protein [Pseudomonas sp. dw_358]